MEIEDILELFHKFVTLSFFFRLHIYVFIIQLCIRDRFLLTNIELLREFTTTGKNESRMIQTKILIIYRRKKGLNCFAVIFLISICIESRNTSSHTRQ